MAYWLRTAALSPLLLAQAAWAVRRAPRLPGPPGPRAGRRGAGRALRVLLVGDSAAVGVGAADQSQALIGQLLARLESDYRVSWRVCAATGDTTADALARLESTAPATYDVAVTSLGVNDITRLVPLSRWLDRQARLRALMRARFGVRLLVLSGLPPVHAFPLLPQPLRRHLGARATRFDERLRAAIAGEADAAHVSLRFSGHVRDMAPDGFHPGPAIYARWAQAVAETIATRWPPRDGAGGEPPRSPDTRPRS